MKKIIINCNDCASLYNFRLGFIKELNKHYDVYLIAKYDKYTPLLQEERLKLITITSNTTSINPFNNFKQIREYRRIFKKIKPNLIINYTIKPHLYATLVAPKKTRIINIVTGVGSVFEKRNLLFKLIKALYQFTSKKVDFYVFLNQDDYLLFSELGILRQQHKIIPGEGVDLDNFYPEVNFKRTPTFIFIGRLIKEKGINEYLEAARVIKKRHPEVKFLIAGDFYRKKSALKRKDLKKYEEEGIIKYLGYRFDINVVLLDVHVVVLPSLREGLPFSLIEGLASKKFLIATDVPGCRDVVIDNYNGFLIHPQSTYDLVLKIEKYLQSENKEELHNNAFSSVSKFDNKKIIPELISLIQEII